MFKFDNEEVQNLKFNGEDVKVLKVDGEYAYCYKEPGEYLYNADFDCGLDGWEPYETGVLTDNGDGTVKVVANGKWDGIITTNPPHETKTWLGEVDIKSFTTECWFSFGVNGDFQVTETGTSYFIWHGLADQGTVTVGPDVLTGEFVVSKLSLKEYIQPADELLINNDFNYGGYGWEVENYDAVDFSNGKCKIYTPMDFPGVSQNLTLEIGDVIECSLEVTNSIGQTGYLIAYDPEGVRIDIIDGTGDGVGVGVHYGELTAEKNGEYKFFIAQRTKSGSETNYVEFDWISLKKI